MAAAESVLPVGSAPKASNRPTRGIVPGNLGRRPHRQPQRPSRPAEGPRRGVGTILVDGGSGAAGLVGPRYAQGRRIIRRRHVGHGPTVTGGRHIPQIHPAAIVIHHRRQLPCPRSPGQFRIDDREVAIAPNGRHGGVTEQLANGDRLPVVVEAKLTLTRQGDVFEGLAVDCPGGRDAATKAVHLHMLHEQRPVHVTMAQIQPHQPLAILLGNHAVANRSEVI